MKIIACKPLNNYTLKIKDINIQLCKRYLKVAQRTHTDKKINIE